MSAVVTVEGICKQFGATVAVNGLCLQLHAGEIYGLLGPDGAGKTTTMRILAGLMGADAGSISALGLTIPGQERLLRRELGYMPQQYSLYGDLSVEENLQFFAGMCGVKSADYATRSWRLLSMARLHEFRQRLAGALSGGMYKKLALACALIHQPRLLLLDEPTNGVDPISRRELWAFLDELVGDNVAVLVSTPYMDEAERCHTVGLLVNGRLVAEGSPQRLIADFTPTVFEVSAASRPPRPELYRSHPRVSDVYTVGKRLHVVANANAEFAAELEERAIAVGLTRVVVRPVKPSFEDVFLGLAAKSVSGGA